MAMTITFLPDSELRTPLVRAIRRAKKSVDMMYFYWKTKYATGGTPPMDVLNAAKEAAAKEEVTVRVLLGYGADVPSIQYLNYLTGEALAAGGVEVRLAPTNRTTHVKMTIVDSGQVFIGSHNVTRGDGGHIFIYHFMASDPQPARAGLDCHHVREEPGAGNRDMEQGTR